MTNVLHFSCRLCPSLGLRPEGRVGSRNSFPHVPPFPSRRHPFKVPLPSEGPSGCSGSSCSIPDLFDSDPLSRSVVDIVVALSVLIVRGSLRRVSCTLLSRHRWCRGSGRPPSVDVRVLKCRRTPYPNTPLLGLGGRDSFLFRRRILLWEGLQGRIIGTHLFSPLTPCFFRSVLTRGDGVGVSVVRRRISVDLVRCNAF